MRTSNPIYYDKRWIGTWDGQGQFHDLQTLSARKIKSLIASKNTETVPSFHNKVVNWGMTNENWKYYHRQVPRLFWSTKLRSFQYKLLTGVIFGREDFFNCGYIESPHCIFCQNGSQNKTHLFVTCSKTIAFCKSIFILIHLPRLSRYHEPIKIV